MAILRIVPAGPANTSTLLRSAGHRCRRSCSPSADQAARCAWPACSLPSLPSSRPGPNKPAWQLGGRTFCSGRWRCNGCCGSGGRRAAAAAVPASTGRVWTAGAASTSRLPTPAGVLCTLPGCTLMVCTLRAQVHSYASRAGPSLQVSSNLQQCACVCWSPVLQGGYPPQQQPGGYPPAEVGSCSSTSCNLCLPRAQLAAHRMLAVPQLMRSRVL